MWMRSFISRPEKYILFEKSLLAIIRLLKIASKKRKIKIRNFMKLWFQQ